MADAKILAAEAKRLLRETASYALEDDARLHQSGALAESIIDQLATLVTESADARDSKRYRELRERARYVDGMLTFDPLPWPSTSQPTTADYADAAIDAALQARAARGES